MNIDNAYLSFYMYKNISNSYNSRPFNVSNTDPRYIVILSKIYYFNILCN